jgi:diguanylate cyclase (GGDEF)-like protein/hemerythrin-like metal-binding protein
MKTLTWDDAFATGVASIDEQHHQMFALVDELSRALRGEGSHNGANVQEIIRKLAESANQHIEDEEKLMRSCGVDRRHFSQHEASHKDFINQASSIWSYQHSMASPADVVHNYWAAWLSYHILTDDMSLVRQLNRIQEGVSASAAFEEEAASRSVSKEHLLLRRLYSVITEQNLELANTNQLLEARVIERTRELEMVNRRLETLTRTDGLTGISNRQYFDERLKAEWNLARRNEQPISLLMMDIDFFKVFNDVYGYIEGDACLRGVSKAAAEGLYRPTDLLARYGGEEFVALLPNTSVEGARLVAERIQLRLKDRAIPHADSTVSDRVTLSIGISYMQPSAGGSVDDLVLGADVALYQAKRRGRNQVFVKPPAEAVRLVKTEKPA